MRIKNKKQAINTLHESDFLFQNSGNNINNILSDITRHFDIALVLNDYNNIMTNIINNPKLKHQPKKIITSALDQIFSPQIVCDEQFIPFKNNSLDLIISNLTLHWVNDLPGSLIQIKNILKNDRPIIASIFGNKTLHELKTCLIESEVQNNNGFSPRIAPLVSAAEVGYLLNRAGFKLTVIENNTIQALYKDAFALMHDLKNMGENNCLTDRNKQLNHRNVITTAAKIYHDKFNHNGDIYASFEIITFIAWKPDNSQPQAKKPGSAKNKLADIL